MLTSDYATDLTMRAVKRLRRRTHSYYPTVPGDVLVIEVVQDHRGIPAGTRGRIECAYGTSMYDFHREIPVDGCGVPHGLAAVVERHESGAITRTPYLDWCRRLDLEVLCMRCRLDILLTHGNPCPQRVASMARSRAKQAVEQALDERRIHWRDAAGPFSVPVHPKPLRGAHDLERGYATLYAAQHAAARFRFDFGGVHLVVQGDWFDVYATEFIAPADGEPHPFGTVASREWPIPSLV